MSEADSELVLGEEYGDFDSDAEGIAEEDEEMHDEEQAVEPTTLPTNSQVGRKSELSASDASQKQADKAAELKKIKDQPGPLNLLKLPVDILRIIVNELTHTNDLNAVALTCSAIHALAVELIYGRFDIVWPDDEVELEETRAGVDALTYGLSTLALAEPMFREEEQHPSPCSQCGHVESSTTSEATVTPPRPRHRVGNNYARYIRRLSIGNGPPQFIRDYTADKEAGKMLNTLVALAVGRCKNLEEFKWDMATGLTRDVWLALGSLRRRPDRKKGGLHKVWIRLHDRKLSAYEPFPRPASAMPPPPPPGSSPPPTIGNHSPPGAAPYPPYPGAPPSPEMQSRDRPINIKNVSLPSRTFSLLQPLQNLCVLEIDAPQYLYEMSDLIGRSIDSLRELRVSLAESLYSRPRDWKEVWEGEDALDPYEVYKTPTVSRSQKRAGGCLGTLVGRFFSVKEYDRALAFTNEPHASSDIKTVEERMAKLNGELQTVSISARPKPSTENKPPTDFDIANKKLALDTLELNFVPLSVSTMAGVLDWSKLTNLTILACPFADNLWASLRRLYTPKGPADGSCFVQLHFPLSLRKIRTDAVSTLFVKLLGETLKPNSVEALFLKEVSTNPKRRPSKIAIKQLFKGAIRRHGNSLQKLSLDSAPRKRNGLLDGKDDNSDYQQWMANRDVLSYITSGAMPKLRELCLSIQYKDWHYFLRRLIRIPALQVLYVPVLHHEGMLQNCRKSDAEDLAYQIADAVTFRPEISLSYFANHNRCFEIYECSGNESADAQADDSHQGGWVEGNASDDSDDDDDGIEVDEDNGDDSNDDTSTDDNDDGSDDDLNADGDAWNVDGAYDKEKNVFNIKEILFPDEKAEVFRTRKLEL